MNVQGKTEFDYIKACKLTPLVKHTQAKQHSIQDLLLSNIAVGFDLSLNQSPKHLMNPYHYQQELLEYRLH